MSRAILGLAQRFRRAIERAKKSQPHIYITLSNFPHGACGDASLLLAKFLVNNGQAGFDYVLGRRQERSHAWLRRSRLIVDITADQFADFSEPVLWREVRVGIVAFMAKCCILRHSKCTTNTRRHHCAQLFEWYRST
jgi:hypothetical protein